MLKLSKETIQFIDRICEDSVNNPPIVKEANDAEDDHIAGIANFIAESVIDNTDLEYIAELLRKITSINFKMIRELITEVAQRRRQQLNLESRVFALERQRQSKGVSSFD